MTPYLFKLPDGSLVEKCFPMGQCPSQIMVDGFPAKRVFTAPSVQIHENRSKQLDNQKTLTEVDEVSHDLGMRALVPLKHQNPRQQLQDLKQNASRFRDDMQKANEQSRQRLKQKQKPLPKMSESQIKQKLQGNPHP